MKNTITYSFYLTILTVSLHATPTSLFWTNCTTDVQTPHTLHLNINKNIKLHNKTHGSVPLDVGLLYGLYGNERVNIEAGVDYQYHIKQPLSFNTKVQITEDSLWHNSPIFSLGAYNLGLTNCKPIVNIATGTSHRDWGKMYFGLYTGKMQWGKHTNGYMIGYQKFFKKVKDVSGNVYNKWLFSIDYASGKNSVSGFGAAFSYYFTPTINLQTGPVCFRNKKLHQVWQWSFQLGIDF